jgi:hypothetical protein
MRFQVLISVSTQMNVFLDVVPCSLEVNDQCFQNICHYETTWCNNSENKHLQSIFYNKNLISHSVYSYVINYTDTCEILILIHM